MPLFGRLLIALAVFATVCFMTFLAMLVMVPEDPEWQAFAAGLLAGAGGALWIWRGLGAAPGGVLATSVKWAMVAGTVGFCGGFFGPLLRK